VRPVVYSQKQEGLHGRETILDMILSRSNLTIGQARGLLGRFLFSGDDVKKRLQDLSGGERSRVALALLSLVEGNLLLLDEPTNHLDLRSQEVLERALLDYEGTIILVSHDRALLEAVATQVWAIEDGRLRVLRCGFAEYRRRAIPSSEERERERSEKPKPKAAPPKPREDRYQQKKRRDALAAIEKRIEDAEAELSEVEDLLAAASEKGDSGEIAGLGERHKSLTERLEKEMRAWEEVADDGSYG
jgi:ATP-binding cassette subfamily F protein 3